MKGSLIFLVTIGCRTPQKEIRFFSFRFFFSFGFVLLVCFPCVAMEMGNEGWEDVLTRGGSGNLSSQKEVVEFLV